jgi:hypothetical protein
MSATPFILTKTDIDTINIIEGLVEDGAFIPSDTAKIYLDFLVKNLKSQAGETKRILHESAEAFGVAAQRMDSLQDRLFQATNGAEGRELKK